WPPAYGIGGAGVYPGVAAPQAGGTAPGRADIGVAAAAGEHRGAGPARPRAGNRVVRVAVVTPADIGADRHVDRLGLVLAHDDLAARDVALAAVVAIGIAGDHDLDIDVVPIRIIEGQPRAAARGRAEHRAAGEQQKYNRPIELHFPLPIVPL